MVATQGLVVIGFFVWWSIHGVKILRDEFQKLLEAFDFAGAMGDMSAEALRRSAFLKAVREVKASNRKFLIRKIKKDANEYVHGLVDESVDKKGKHLDYAHTATMTFNPTTGELTCDFHHRAYEDIQKKYEEYKDYMNSDDVRAVVLNIIDSFRKVGVRGRGGIYFVPAEFEEKLGKLSDMLDQVGEDANLEVAPQIDAESSKKAIYKAFVRGLKDKIKAFKEEMENDGLKRKSSWENRLEEFKTLREEIDFYKDRMAFQAENLEDELKELSAEVKKKLVD